MILSLVYVSTKHKTTSSSHFKCEYSVNVITRLSMVKTLLNVTPWLPE